MFSGLNLACFSVSRLQLEIDASNNNQDAVKVLGFRKDSNFLLTTILWGNVSVNTLLALLSGSVLGGRRGLSVFDRVHNSLRGDHPPGVLLPEGVESCRPAVAGLEVLPNAPYPVAKPTAKFLDWWLGPEGVHYLREEMLTQYIGKSMHSGGDIGMFEGRGAVNFLALDSRRVGEEGAILDPRSVVSLPLVDGHLEIFRRPLSHPRMTLLSAYRHRAKSGSS